MGGFDAFGDDGEAHGLAEAQHGANYGVAGGVGAEAGGEAEVDFEDVNGEFGDVGQAAVAGADVVEGDANAAVAEVVEVGEQRLGDVGHVGFGELEDEAAGGQRVGGERVEDIGGEVAGFELTAGDVDMDAGSGAAELFAPGGRHPAGLGQGPLTEGDHERAVFGYVEELAGGQDAPHRVSPTDQGFDGDGDPGGEIDDGLAVHDQLAVADGVMQFGQQPGRAGRPGQFLDPGGSDAVLPRPFGRVHGGIGGG